MPILKLPTPPPTGLPCWLLPLPLLRRVDDDGNGEAPTCAARIMSRRLPPPPPPSASLARGWLWLTATKPSEHLQKNARRVSTMQHRFIIALYIAPRAVGCMQWFPGIVSHCRWGAGLFFEGMTFSCIEPRFRRGWLFVFHLSVCVAASANSYPQTEGCTVQHLTKGSYSTKSRSQEIQGSQPQAAFYRRAAGNKPEGREAPTRSRVTLIRGRESRERENATHRRCHRGE